MAAEWGMGKARKRVLKQARKIPEAEIVNFLTSTGTPLSNYYLSDQHGYTFICLWHPQNGSMEMLIEDGTIEVAVIQYLKRQGVPLISTRDEWEQLARRNNWCNSNPRRHENEAGCRPE